MILCDHSAEDFDVKVDYRIAQLILEWIETPQVKKVAALDDTNCGAGGVGSKGMQSTHLSPTQIRKKVKRKRIFYPLN